MCLITPHEVTEIEERPPRHYNERRSSRLAFVKDAPTARSSRSSFYSDIYPPPPPPPAIQFNPYYASNTLPQHNTHGPYSQSSSHYAVPGSPVPATGPGYIDEDDGTVETMSMQGGGYAGNGQQRLFDPHRMNQQYNLPSNMRHHYPDRATPFEAGGLGQGYAQGGGGHGGLNHNMGGGYGNPMRSSFNDYGGVRDNAYGNFGHGGYRR